MLLGKLLALIITVVGISFLAWKRPHILVYLLAGCVAFDISSTWYPALGSGELGSLSLARIVSVAIYVTACSRVVFDRGSRLRLKIIIMSPLTWTLAAYVMLGMLSLSHTETVRKTIIEVVRLCSLVALFVSCGLLAKPNGGKIIFQVVHWTGVALFPIAVWQRLTGKALWMQVYAYGEIRANTTFLDPNIYARFLVLSIIANLVLQLLNKNKSLAYLASLVLLLAQIILSVSRSGMITAALLVLMLLLLLPARKLFISFGVLTCGGFGLLLLSSGLYRRLLETASHGFTSYDPDRAGLWRAALAMFKDHPLLGIGLGGFERAFLNEYSGLRLVNWGATLSHTTLLTIAAELGALGLAALGLVWIMIVQLYIQLRKISTETKILGTGFLLWIVTVFVHSQFEARFFEDPLIWLSMAYMVLMVKIPTFGTKY